MMKRVSLLVILLLAGFVFSTGNAMATPVTFTMDGLWDWGTVYGLNGGTWSATNANPYYGTTGQSLVNGAVTAADGKEDSFGIARVDTIVDSDGNTLFDRAVNSYELTTFFYGFDDIYLNGTASSTRILSSGGHAALYMDPSRNYTPATPPSASSRTGAGSFPTITDGTLALDLTPRVIIDGVTGASYTLDNTFSFNTFSGSGSVLFDVTGGAWQNVFDTNTLQFGTDIVFNFSSLPATVGQPGVRYREWEVRGSGNAQADVVPEPASMTLLGLGLAGLVRFRRKR